MTEVPWRFPNAYHQFIHRRFFRFWWRLRFVLTGDCGHNCEFVEQFGCFVPEAECPVHDV